MRINPAGGKAGGAAEILTVREVAGYFKLPVSTVYRLAQRRKLPGHKVGRQWRFHKVVLDDWFRQHAATSRFTIRVLDDENGDPGAPGHGPRDHEPRGVDRRQR